MTHVLDLADIQGNVLTAYGKTGFPKGRMLLFTVTNAAAGRNFVDRVRMRVTTALRWRSRRREQDENVDYQPRPLVTVNLAFTFAGLLALGVPTRTLRGLPDEFIDGMERRARILGDELHITPTGEPEPNRNAPWDPVWLRDGPGLTRVHILVSLNAQMSNDGLPVPELATTSDWICRCASDTEGGVALLSGHSGPDPNWQDMSALMVSGPDGTKEPCPKEHFGFTDGIGDPAFHGQYPDGEMKLQVVGRGRLSGGQTWSPLATGEFLLGHPDEAQEIPGSAMPLDFSRNGTFMAYRKLHQNVASFRTAIATAAEQYQAVAGIVGPPEVGIQTLMAKISGRWSNGVPLMAAPTYTDWRAFTDRFDAAEKAGDAKALAEFSLKFNDFVYRPDPDGIKCPVTAHIRRINTRDQLDPYYASNDKSSWAGSVLNNRRRILRRGLPYGISGPESRDEDDHGIIMLCVCASLFRQFEFVQQQWINYGLDSNAGNDSCPLVGLHHQDAKFIIPGDPAIGQQPFVMTRLPQFVETRGGDYFFVPSLTALRMIAMGVVDPT